MVSTLDNFFKFKIGDLVKHKGLDVKFQRGLITSRTLEECPGGYQKHYHIRWTSDPVEAIREGILGKGSFGVLKDLFTHNEVELEKWEPRKEETNVSLKAEGEGIKEAVEGLANAAKKIGQP